MKSNYQIQRVREYVCACMRAIEVPSVMLYGFLSYAQNCVEPALRNIREINELWSSNLNINTIVM